MKLSTEQEVLLHFLLALIRINKTSGEKTIMKVLNNNQYNPTDKIVINTLKSQFHDEIQRWYYPERYERR